MSSPRASLRVTAVSILAGLVAGCGAEDEPAPTLEPGVVQLHVDAQGVAHFTAPSDPSLFWASGYVQAETRLVQMILLRRRALGRQAEVLGRAKVDEDELSRLFNFRDLGAADIARLREEHPEDHALIEAWVAGVNAYIEAVNTGEVPTPAGLGGEGLELEPELWTPEDVGAVAKLLMFGNSNSLENELLATVLARIDPSLFEALELPRPAYPVFTLPAEDVPAGLGPAPEPGTKVIDHLPPAPAGVDPLPTVEGLKRLHETLAEFSVEGSNAWVVAGEHSASGRPLLANDPHQPLTSPAIVYALHLDSKQGSGTFNVAGFAFAGTPGVQLGHNEAVAWGATTGTADVMDMWSVSTDPASQTAMVGGSELAYVPRTEIIGVRGEADETLVVDELPGYGILLGDALLMDLGINEEFVAGAGRRLLLDWTGFEYGNELHAFFSMARAQDADAYQRAAEQMEVGTFNWMYADAEHIGYRSRILVPDRGDPSDIVVPFMMLDGDDPSGYWSGEVLADALLPASRDPAQGYLLSANNEPYGFTEDGSVADDPFYFGTYFLPGFRARRAEDRLLDMFAEGGVDVAQMQTLQLDTYVSEADLILPVLFAAWDAVGSDPELADFEGREDLATLVAELEGWNRRMDADAGEAVAFYVFAHELARASVGDEMSLVFEAVVGAAPAFPLKFSALAVTGAYPNGDSLVDGSVELLALTALDACASWLADETGSSSSAGLRWDDYHLSDFSSPVEALSWGQVGSPGSVGTLNQATARYFDAEGEVASRFISTNGAMFRSVVEFDEGGRPRMHYNYAPGNGGSPEGGFWGDLVADWVAGTYFEMPFTPDGIEAASVEQRSIEVPEDWW